MLKHKNVSDILWGIVDELTFVSCVLFYDMLSSYCSNVTEHFSMTGRRMLQMNAWFHQCFWKTRWLHPKRYRKWFVASVRWRSHVHKKVAAALKHNYHVPCSVSVMETDVTTCAQFRRAALKMKATMRMKAKVLIMLTNNKDELFTILLCA